MKKIVLLGLSLLTLAACSSIPKAQVSQELTSKRKECINMDGYSDSQSCSMFFKSYYSELYGHELSYGEAIDSDKCDLYRSEVSPYGAHPEFDNYSCKAVKRREDAYKCSKSSLSCFSNWLSGSSK